MWKYSYQSRYNVKKEKMMNYEKKPKCPRCRTDVNVVIHSTYYYCCFCGKKWRKKGQTTLI